jgi:hypothetical protein|tara:strand:- start:9096 stop:9629 length:534 start_codon:yes stop_codon:yes gene_type:complete
MPVINFQPVDAPKELKFIKIELDKLIVEYEKRFNKYISKMKAKQDTEEELVKLNEINTAIEILIERVDAMQGHFQKIESYNNTLFTYLKGKIKTPYNNLQNERIKLNNITDEVKNLENKNKDGKINNKSISAKYSITFFFVIIIIFLSIRSFIYLETNNIDIIILISIIFLIIFQFI